MGNEASTPHQHEGLAPPSQIPPGEAFDHASANHRPGHSIKAMFHRGGKAEDGHDGGGGGARAATENGLLPFGVTTTTAPLSATPALQGTQFLQVPYDARAQSGATKPLYPQSAHSSFASSNTGPVDVTQQPHPMVGVMYATEGGTSGSRSTGNTLRNSGKVVRESGRKVINSLKNLSLGQRTSSKKTTQKEESEWETRWDEDDDESDEEEDVKIGPASAGVHLRPGMDGGHSSSTPTMRVEPAAPLTLFAEANIPPVTPPRVKPAAAQVEAALDADGLEWDTGTGLDIIPQQDPTYEKPNIQMFLPLLRVLGKGSFGKVRI